MMMARLMRRRTVAVAAPPGCGSGPRRFLLSTVDTLFRFCWSFGQAGENLVLPRDRAMNGKQPAQPHYIF
jgi:hypothetical protein